MLAGVAPKQVRKGAGGHGGRPARSSWTLLMLSIKPMATSALAQAAPWCSGGLLLACLEDGGQQPPLLRARL